MHGAADESQGDQNSVELVVPDLGSLFQTVPVAGNFDAGLVGVDALGQPREHPTITS